VDLKQAPAIWAGFVAGALAGFFARDLDLPTLVSYWGDLVPLVVATALVGAALGATRLRRLVPALAVALGLLWGLVAFTPLVGVLTADLPRRDPLRHADAVFVLSSDLQKDGELTALAESRLLHGLELVGQGQAARLVVSELPAPTPSYAAAARGLAERLRLAPELIVVGPVRTTRDEAVLLGRLCRQRGWSRLLVVTSPLHSRRACAAIEHEGVQVVSSPAPETRYDLETLDRADARLQAFGAWLHERAGLIVYRRSGWI
jgi:uncharacterized SAM-binding protein YcdF (DUF218 family)